MDAFVCDGDRVLCHQTLEGWWPLSQQLPLTHQRQEKREAHVYQVGYVTLLVDLVPSHRSSKRQAQEALSAQTVHAMTYDYAVASGVTLPVLGTKGEYAFVPYRQLIACVPIGVSYALSQAIQLLRWQAETRFCGRCAAALVHATKNERAMVCPVCQLRQYPRVQPCVITAITRPNPQTGDLQILLAHHHRYGRQKTATQGLQYGLIAGFVEVGETLEQAVAREAAEEVNISLTDIRYVSSQPWPFPSNLMLGFRAHYAAGDLVIQQDELSHADFFDLSNLPKIPAKGSIAYELITHIMREQNVPY